MINMHFFFKTNKNVLSGYKQDKTLFLIEFTKFMKSYKQDYI